MESLLKEWNGETVIISYDHPTGAWTFIAIYSTKLGPAVGGTRMKSYPDFQSALQDVLRLAEGMTYKLELITSKLKSNTESRSFSCIKVGIESKREEKQ